MRNIVWSNDDTGKYQSVLDLDEIMYIDTQKKVVVFKGGYTVSFEYQAAINSIAKALVESAKRKE